MVYWDSEGIPETVGGLKILLLLLPLLNLQQLGGDCYDGSVRHFRRLAENLQYSVKSRKSDLLHLL